MLGTRLEKARRINLQNSSEDCVTGNKRCLSRIFQHFLICPLQAARICLRLSYLHGWHELCTWFIRYLHVLREITWHTRAGMQNSSNLLTNNCARREARLRAWKTRERWNPSGSRAPPFTFTSQEWPKYDFSLEYQYIIKQKRDENKENYQLRDTVFMSHQILTTSALWMHGNQ